MKKIIFLPVLLILLGLIDVGTGSLISDYISGIEPEFDYSAVAKVTVGKTSDKIDILKIGEYMLLTVRGKSSSIYIVKKGETYSVVTDQPVNIGGLLWSYRFSKDVKLISKNYNIVFEGYEMVNKIKSSRMTFNPKYNSGIKRTVWIGVSPKIILKLEDRDRKGNLLRSREILSISLNPPSSKKKVVESLFKKGIKLPAREKLLSLHQANKELDFELVIPGDLPLGYEFIGADIPQEGVGQLVFSDGIGFISIYEIKIPWWARQDMPPEKKEYIEWENKGIHFIVVGDPPTDILLLIANSMKK